MPPNFFLKNGQNFEKKVAKLANWPGLVNFRVATQNWPIRPKSMKNEFKVRKIEPKVRKMIGKMALCKNWPIGQVFYYFL